MSRYVLARSLILLRPLRRPALWAFLIVLFTTGCGPARERIQVGGSTAFLPLVEAAARAFSHRTGADVELFGGGSQMGLTQLQSGVLDLAVSDLPERPPGLREMTLARVPVAFVVGRGFPVPALSRFLLARIFAGDVTEWARMGGPRLRVLVVSRAAGSGTREAVRRYLFPRGDFSPRALVVDSNGLMGLVVSETPGAIGYVEEGAGGRGVVALRLDGRRPGEPGYPLWLTGRIFWRRLTPAGERFLLFLRHFVGSGAGPCRPVER